MSLKATKPGTGNQGVHLHKDQDKAYFEVSFHVFASLWCESKIFIPLKFTEIFSPTAENFKAKFCVPTMR